jgi:hypothetical protein
MNSDSLIPFILIVCIIAITLISIVLSIRGKKTQHLLTDVRGRIDQPSNGATVARSIHCRGVCERQMSAVDLVFWLAIETGGLVWPKEALVSPDDSGHWSSTIQEGGSPEMFTISLWAVTPQGAKGIQAWFEAGRRTSNFPGMSALPGARRIAQVHDLKLVD